VWIIVGWIVHSEGTIEMIFEGVTPNEKETKKQNDGEKTKGQANRPGESKPLPLLIQRVRRARAFLCHRCEFHPESQRDPGPSGW